jgi:putative DNA primase/helicase
MTAEIKNGEIFESINQAALVCAGNHFPKLKTSNQSNAFADRLLIVPLLNPVSKERQDIHLLEKLRSEKSNIVRWAMIGLNRFIRQNNQFTSCDLIEEMLTEYSRTNNTVKMFVEQWCVKRPDLKLHTHELEEAYKAFCLSIRESPLEGVPFHESLKAIQWVFNGRFRLNGENRNGYYGLALRDDVYQ